MKAAVLAAALAHGCAGAAAGTEPTGPTLRLTLPDLDGGFIDFTALQGKPLVVHVFTTWAMPAADDAERLRALAASDKKLTVVGVALDRGRANPGSAEGASEARRSQIQIVRAWRRAMEVEYSIALADDAVRAGRSLLGPTQQVPITLLYNRRGRLIERWDGPLGDSGIAKIRDLADTSRRMR